jgi:1-acyl-sn-glycerol-3-phosphate acyltransferase
MTIVDLLSPLVKAVLDRCADIKILNKPDFLNCNGALIAANHKGWADCLWLAYAVYPRKLYFLSKKELLEKTTHRLFLQQAGVLPVDRRHPTAKSIKMACHLLAQGNLLLIFPGGTRTEDRIPFKRGAATIAYHAQVPIIPAFYEGPKTIQFRHFFERPRILVTFGRPIWVMNSDRSKRELLQASEELQIEIDRLRDYTSLLQGT